MQPLDDSDLLRQYVECQSDTAFAALVTNRVNLVYSVALRQVGNPHHAEEITQAVFIILARKAGQLRHNKALSSWLFQTTRLTANNFLRSEIRRQQRNQEAYMESTLNEPVNETWPQIAALLDPAVEKLGEKDRRAIVLRFYEGRNLRDVGLAMDASEAAAEKRVCRALEKLRKFFAKRGVTLTVTAIAGAVSTNSVQAAPAAMVKIISAVALTKGATAATSTLTLVKGALKLMTLSKIKTAVAVSAIVLAVGGSAIAIGELEHQPQASAITEASVREGLVLDYKFDHGVVDGHITDASGAGNNGQVVGAQWTSDPQRGGVIQFSPPNQYILVPNSASLNPSNLTLAAWIKTSNQGDTWRRVFDKSFTNGYSLSVGGGHTGGTNSFQGKAVVEIGMRINNKKGIVRSDRTVTDGQWHHLVVTYNGAAQILYVDGVRQLRVSHWTGRVPANAYDLTLGMNLVDPNPEYNEVGASFDGLMDEPMIFNRALSTNEVEFLFNSQRK